MRVGSLGQARRTNKVCGLCGSASAKLTRTHIPPRAAGNQGASRRGVEYIDATGASRLGLSRPSGGGGAWGRWLCGRCNTLTGRWDQEYARWSTEIVLKLHDRNPGVGASLVCEIIDGDPGAVVRSMWAWMFALDPELRPRHQTLAESVRSGAAVEPPSDVRLLLGATRSLRIWVSGQAGGFAVRSPIVGHTTAGGIWVAGSEIVDVPRVAISSPPFVVLFGESGHDVRAPYFDTAEWLREPANSYRTVALQLPIVKAFDADEAVTLVTYEQLVT